MCQLMTQEHSQPEAVLMVCPEKISNTASNNQLGSALFIIFHQCPHLEHFHLLSRSELCNFKSSFPGTRVMSPPLKERANGTLITAGINACTIKSTKNHGITSAIGRITTLCG